MKSFGIRKQRFGALVLAVMGGGLSVFLVFFSVQAAGPAYSGVGAIDVVYNAHDGYIYVLNSNDTVSVLTQTAVIATIDLPTGSLSRMTDMTVAVNGDIYVSQWFFDQVIVIRDRQLFGIVPRQVDGQPPNGIENGPIAMAANPVNGYIYVATSWRGDVENNNGVTVLDGTRVVSHLPTGNTPHYPEAIAINPVTGRVYIANSGSNLVTVISHTTILNQIPVDDTPVALAVDPIHGLIYVANRTSHTVSILDEESGSVLRSIPVGDTPVAVYADALAGWAYVVNRVGNSISVVDGLALTLTQTIPVGQNPLAIAGDPSSGLVYVVNQVGNSVSIIDGAELTATITVGSSPVALVAAPNNHVYVASFGNATISVLAGPTLVSTIPNLPRLAHSSIEVLPDGRVIAADLTGKEALFLEGQTVITAVKTITSPQTLSTSPGREPLYEHLQVAHESIAVDAQGTVYIANFHDESVTVISADGSKVQSIPVDGQPYDLAYLSGTNQVYISVGNGITLLRNNNGAISTEYLNDPRLAGARALTTWPERERVYIAHSPGGDQARVTILDTSMTTPTISHTIDVCDVPAALDVDRTRGLVYISCSGMNMVGIISDTTWLGQVSVGWFPQDIIVDPVNGYAYVAASLADQIAVLDGLEVVATIPVPENPIALDVDPAGLVYATSTVGNAVSVISGTVLLTTIPTGAYPDAVLASGGAVYVGNAHDARVDVFQFEQLHTDPGNDWPQAVPINKGKVYAAQIDDEADVDWYKIHLAQPGSEITVTLGGLTADYDLALFNPLTSTETTSSTIETLDVAQILGDGSLRSLSGWVDLGQLRDLPIRRGIVSLSSNPFLEPEVLADKIWASGDYYIAVWGHNGAYASQAYTLRAEIQEPANSITSAQSITPTTTPIMPPDAQVRAVVVTHGERLQQQFGVTRTAVLTATLEELAAAVTGTVVYLENYPDADAAYTQWESAGQTQNPLAANYVAEIIKHIINGLLTVSYPNAAYIVVVGDDNIVPFYRIPDSTLISNERSYNALASDDSATTARLRGGYLLSDNYYASLYPLPWQGRELLIPNYAIGRLVETPEEIGVTIQAFLNQGPTLFVDTALVSGYDFVKNGAEAISQTIGSSGVNVTPVISDGWSADVLRPFLLNNDNDFISLNGHFNHWLLLAGDESTTITSSEIIQAPTNYLLDLVISIGCQAGLNIPDGDIDAAILAEYPALARDFAQAFNGRGAAFIANTGFGYGDSDAVGYSETLARNLVQELVNGSPLSIGEALMLAKQAYYTNVGYGAFSDYDEKVLSEWTLYGLPMMQVSLPPSQGQLLPEQAQTALPSGISPVPSASTFFSTLPLTMATSFNLITSTRPVNNSPTLIGNYYEVSGSAEMAGSPIPLASDFLINPGRPLQPRISLDLNLPNQEAHGILFLGGTYTDAVGFNPIISRVVSDTAMSEPSFPFFRWYPLPMQIINRLQLGPQLISEKLVVVPAQYLAETDSLGTERLYNTLLYEVFYTPEGATDDFTAPTINQVQVITSTTAVSFTVSVADASNVARVVVVYDDGSGNWQSVALTQIDDIHWSGPGPASLSYMLVQAVDTYGNVSLSDNKGVFFTTVGMEFEPDQAASGRPGEEVSYFHTLVNRGGGTDTFILSVQSSSNWAVVERPSLLTLAPGESAKISVTVKIPDHVLAGATHMVTVTAVSLANTAVVDMVTDVTTANQVASLELSADAFGQILPNGLLTYTHRLTNTGNGTDSYRLTVNGGTLIGPSLVSLPSGAVISLTVAATAPCVTSGTLQIATLTVVSLSDPMVQGSIMMTSIVGQERGVLLSPTQTGSVMPGGQLSFSHMITNSGNVADVFLLTTVSEPSWSVTYPPTITLPACTATSFLLHVSVPQTSNVGSTEEINITVISSSDSQIKDSVTDVLTISPYANFLPLVQINHPAVRVRYNTLNIFFVPYQPIRKAKNAPILPAASS